MSKRRHIKEPPKQSIDTNIFQNRQLDISRYVNDVLALSESYRDITQDKMRVMDGIESEIYTRVRRDVEAVDWGALENEIARNNTIYNQMRSIVPVFIGFQNLAIMSTIPVISRVIEIKPRASIKNGWKIVGQSDDIKVDRLIELKEETDKKYNIANICKEILRKSLIYGGCYVYYDIFGLDVEQPYNDEAVLQGFYQGIKILDPQRVVPIITDDSINPLSDYYYEPRYYSIVNTPYNMVDGSNILKIVPEPVEPILRPTYRYFGQSVVQNIYPYAQAVIDSLMEVPQLLKTKRLNVFKTNTVQMFETQQAFTERMRIMNLTRNNYGQCVIHNGGGDPSLAEDLQQLDTSLSEVAVVIEKLIDSLGMISGTPVTKITGNLNKGGLGNTGEFDLETWHESVREIQQFLLPVLYRHYDAVYRSYTGEEPPSYTIEFESVNDTTPEEIAQIRNMNADYLQKLAGSGIITDVESRQFLQQEKLSGFNSIDPDALDDIDSPLDDVLGEYRHAEETEVQEAPSPWDKQEHSEQVQEEYTG